LLGCRKYAEKILKKKKRKHLEAAAIYRNSKHITHE
jgi:hypothetical protein